MLTKQQLQLINRNQLGYPLDIAEKDYHLALAARLIGESQLGKILVLKGGTAIHHCYLPQYRFSEDLDFTSLDQDIDLQTVVTALESTGEFTVRKKYESPATIKIERLRPISIPYTNVWNISAGIQTMQLPEITAEKIRASATRARYRDFYDLFLLLERADADLDQAFTLLRRKEIRSVVSPAAIVSNWRQAKEEANDDLRSIYCTRQVESHAIENMLAVLQFEPLLPGHEPGGQ